MMWVEARARPRAKLHSRFGAENFHNHTCCTSVLGKAAGDPSVVGKQQCRTLDGTVTSQLENCSQYPSIIAINNTSRDTRRYGTISQRPAALRKHDSIEDMMQTDVQAHPMWQANENGNIVLCTSPDHQWQHVQQLRSPQASLKGEGREFSALLASVENSLGGLRQEVDAVRQLKAGSAWSSSSGSAALPAVDAVVESFNRRFSLPPKGFGDDAGSRRASLGSRYLSPCTVDPWAQELDSLSTAANSLQERIYVAVETALKQASSACNSMDGSKEAPAPMAQAVVDTAHTAATPSPLSRVSALHNSSTMDPEQLSKLYRAVERSEAAESAAKAAADTAKAAEDTAKAAEQRAIAAEKLGEQLLDRVQALEQQVKAMKIKADMQYEQASSYAAELVSVAKQDLQQQVDRMKRTVQQQATDLGQLSNRLEDHNQAGDEQRRQLQQQLDRWKQQLEQQQRGLAQLTADMQDQHQQLCHRMQAAVDAAQEESLRQEGLMLNLQHDVQDVKQKAEQQEMAFRNVVQDSEDQLSRRLEGLQLRLQSIEEEQEHLIEQQQLLARDLDVSQEPVGEDCSTLAITEPQQRHDVLPECRQPAEQAAASAVDTTTAASESTAALAAGVVCASSLFPMLPETQDMVSSSVHGENTHDKPCSSSNELVSIAAVEELRQQLQELKQQLRVIEAQAADSLPLDSMAVGAVEARLCILEEDYAERQQHRDDTEDDVSLSPLQNGLAALVERVDAMEAQQQQQLQQQSDLSTAQSSEALTPALELQSTVKTRVEQFEEQLNAAINRFAPGSQTPSAYGAAAGSASKNSSQRSLSLDQSLAGNDCSRETLLGQLETQQQQQQQQQHDKEAFEATCISTGTAALLQQLQQHVDQAHHAAQTAEGAAADCRQTAEDAHRDVQQMRKETGPAIEQLQQGLQAVQAAVEEGIGRVQQQVQDAVAAAAAAKETADLTQPMQQQAQEKMENVVNQLQQDVQRALAAASAAQFTAGEVSEQVEALQLPNSRQLQESTSEALQQLQLDVQQALAAAAKAEHAASEGKQLASQWEQLQQDVEQAMAAASATAAVAQHSKETAELTEQTRQDLQQLEQQVCSLTSQLEHNIRDAAPVVENDAALTQAVQRLEQDVTMMTDTVAAVDTRLATMEVEQQQWLSKVQGLQLMVDQIAADAKQAAAAVDPADLQGLQGLSFVETIPAGGSCDNQHNTTCLFAAAAVDVPVAPPVVDDVIEQQQQQQQQQLDDLAQQLFDLRVEMQNGLDDTAKRLQDLDILEESRKAAATRAEAATADALDKIEALMQRNAQNDLGVVKDQQQQQQQQLQELKAVVEQLESQIIPGLTQQIVQHVTTAEQTSLQLQQVLQLQKDIDEHHIALEILPQLQKDIDEHHNALEVLPQLQKDINEHHNALDRITERVLPGITCTLANQSSSIKQIQQQLQQVQLQAEEHSSDMKQVMQQLQQDLPQLREQIEGQDTALHDIALQLDEVIPQLQADIQELGSTVTQVAQQLQTMLPKLSTQPTEQTCQQQQAIQELGQSHDTLSEKVQQCQQQLLDLQRNHEEEYQQLEQQLLEQVQPDALEALQELQDQVQQLQQQGLQSRLQELLQQVQQQQHTQEACIRHIEQVEQQVANLQDVPGKLVGLSTDIQQLQQAGQENVHQVLQVERLVQHLTDSVSAAAADVAKALLDSSFAITEVKALRDDVDEALAANSPFSPAPSSLSSPGQTPLAHGFTRHTVPIHSASNIPHDSQSEETADDETPTARRGLLFHLEASPGSQSDERSDAAAEGEAAKAAEEGFADYRVLRHTASSSLQPYVMRASIDSLNSPSFRAATAAATYTAAYSSVTIAADDTAWDTHHGAPGASYDHSAAAGAVHGDAEQHAAAVSTAGVIASSISTHALVDSAVFENRLFDGSDREDEQEELTAPVSAGSGGQLTPLTSTPRLSAASSYVLQASNSQSGLGFAATAAAAAGFEEAVDVAVVVAAAGNSAAATPLSVYKNAVFEEEERQEQGAGRGDHWDGASNQTAAATAAGALIENAPSGELLIRNSQKPQQRMQYQQPQVVGTLTGFSSSDDEDEDDAGSTEHSLSKLSSTDSDGDVVEYHYTAAAELVHPVHIDGGVAPEHSLGLPGSQAQQTYHSDTESDMPKQQQQQQVPNAAPQQQASEHSQVEQYAGSSCMHISDSDEQSDFDDQDDLPVMRISGGGCFEPADTDDESDCCDTIPEGATNRCHDLYAKSHQQHQQQWQWQDAAMSSPQSSHGLPVLRLRGGADYLEDGLEASYISTTPERQAGSQKESMLQVAVQRDMNAATADLQQQAKGSRSLHAVSSEDESLSDSSNSWSIAAAPAASATAAPQPYQGSHTASCSAGKVRCSTDTVNNDAADTLSCSSSSSESDTELSHISVAADFSSAGLCWVRGPPPADWHLQRGGYRIAVHTSDRSGAGTRARVTLCLTGASGSTYTHQLSRYQNRCRFQAGSIVQDWLQLPHTAAEPAGFCGLRVLHDGPGYRSAWLLDWVIVQLVMSGEWWQFRNTQGWLKGTGCGGGSTAETGSTGACSRELMLVASGVVENCPLSGVEACSMQPAAETRTVELTADALMQHGVLATQSAMMAAAAAAAPAESNPMPASNDLISSISRELSCGAVSKNSIDDGHLGSQQMCQHTQQQHQALFNQPPDTVMPQAAVDAVLAQGLCVRSVCSSSSYSSEDDAAARPGIPGATAIASVFTPYDDVELKHRGSPRCCQIGQQRSGSPLKRHSSGSSGCMSSAEGGGYASSAQHVVDFADGILSAVQPAVGDKASCSSTAGAADLAILAASRQQQLQGDFAANSPNTAVAAAAGAAADSLVVLAAAHGSYTGLSTPASGSLGVRLPKHAASGRVAGSAGRIKHVPLILGYSSDDGCAATTDHDHRDSFLQHKQPGSKVPLTGREAGNGAPYACSNKAEALLADGVEQLDGVTYPQRLSNSSSCSYNGSRSRRKVRFSEWAEQLEFDSSSSDESDGSSVESFTEEQLLDAQGGGEFTRGQMPSVGYGSIMSGTADAVGGLPCNKGEPSQGVTDTQQLPAAQVAGRSSTSMEEVPLVAARPSHKATEYQLRVYTADRVSASLPSGQHVMLEILGSASSRKEQQEYSGPVLLITELPRQKGAFRRGCVDRFTLYSVLGDVGEICAVRLWHEPDGVALGKGWYLDKLEIEHRFKGVKWRFSSPEVDGCCVGRGRRRAVVLTRPQIVKRDDTEALQAEAAELHMQLLSNIKLSNEDRHLLCTRLQQLQGKGIAVNVASTGNPRRGSMSRS